MPETSHSLLERLERKDTASWEQMVKVYTPLLHGWLRRYDVLSSTDVDDLVQEVLLTLSQELPTFQHNRRPGAFRAWLRAILWNRLRNFWQIRHRGTIAVGGSDFLEQMEQLQDSSSQPTAMFDKEHDQQVMQQLLDMIRPQFSSASWEVFRRVVLEGATPEAVAGETGRTLNSIYAIKSRVLKALRKLADGLF